MFLRFPFAPFTTHPLLLVCSHAELEALPLEELNEKLAMHDLMDLALQWKVVASAGEFWQLHKHKDDLVAALYDDFSKKLAAHIVAERAHVEEFERARRARLAAEEEVLKAHKSRSRAGSGAHTPAPESPAMRRLRCAVRRRANGARAHPPRARSRQQCPHPPHPVLQRNGRWEVLGGVNPPLP